MKGEPRPDGVTVRRPGPGDDAEVMAAASLFDKPPVASHVSRFLAEPTHHILIACKGGEPVGFVSGVETTHPDKGTEMFLYELGVAPAHQRQGVATHLVTSLLKLAQERGCYGMWVIADDDNLAALATYRAAGATREEISTGFTWEWDN